MALIPAVLISSGNLLEMQICRPHSRPIVYVSLEEQPSKLLVANLPSDSEAYSNLRTVFQFQWVKWGGKEMARTIGIGVDNFLRYQSTVLWAWWIFLGSQQQLAVFIVLFVCFYLGSWIEKKHEKAQ